MNEMLNKKDVLDAIEKKMKVVNEADGDADVILGLAAAMSTVKQMQGTPVNPAEEQEPCEDAISRQAVLCKIDKQFDLAKPFKQLIKSMPPVTPAEKVGKWILHDECSNSGYYCSECQKKVVKEGWSNTVKKIKYCPNCGAKMQEVEE